MGLPVTERGVKYSLSNEACIWKTEIYETLMDKETKLYCESKEAVWDMLISELYGHFEK